MSENTILVLKCGKLINGTGKEPVENVVVVIKGSKIIGVGKKEAVEIPDGAKVIDVTGMTVMPGLIDSHMHLMGMKTDNFVLEMHVIPEEVKLIRAVVDASRLLDAGFTTVKDCGGTNALYIKRAIAEGTIRGPNIVAAGPVLGITGGHSDTHYLPYNWAKEIRMMTICDGVDECMKGARLSLREGADFIKMCTTGGVMSERDSPKQTQFTMDEIKAVVEVAHHAGKFVTAHCQGTEGMHQSIEGGIKTIDHAFYPDQEVIEMGIKKGIIFVPTLAIVHVIIQPSMANIMPEWGVRKAKEAWEDMIKNIARLKEAGAIMAMATDYCGSTSMMQGTNAIEMELLVKYCGYSPMEAIKAATWGGSMACGLEDQIGTIEAGKLADLIIVDGDPLKDITIFQDHDRIKMVLKNGKIEVNRGLKIPNLKEKE